jgi:hypothetical protein
MFTLKKTLSAKFTFLLFWLSAITQASMANLSTAPEVTVYFKTKNPTCIPMVYYWNDALGGKNNKWPGENMSKAPEIGLDWFRFTIPNTTGANVIFHDNCGYKSPDLMSISGGCYDAKVNKWIKCNSGELPSLSISPKGGSFKDPVKVTLSATDPSDPDPLIYYTTDGSIPTSASAHFNKSGSLDFNSSTTLNAFAADKDGNSTKMQTEVYSFTQSGGLTVFFKTIHPTCIPKIHFWNKVPGGGGSIWPGVAMETAPENGQGWFKYSIAGASSVNLLFHDDCGYKSADFNNVKGGCFDASVNNWVNCKSQDSVTVYFKTKKGLCMPPKVHFWNKVPGGGGSVWPGEAMGLASEKGPDWYKLNIPNASSVSLLFHDGCKYKTPDYNKITGGCYDASTNDWVNCKATTIPVLSISPKGGNFSSAVKVILSATDAEDPNPSIYYTTDGSTPTTLSAHFSKQDTLLISEETILKAFAGDSMGHTSEIQTEKYTFHPNPSVTIFFKSKEILCTPPKIHFWDVVPKKDGSKWPGKAMVPAPEKGPGWYKFTVEDAESVSLLFHDDCKYKTKDFNKISGGCFDSAINGWVDCKEIHAPVLTFSPKGGNYSDTLMVGLIATDENDTIPTIYYTTDGSTPTKSSDSFPKSGSITISSNTIIKAFASDNTDHESGIQTELYTFNPDSFVTVFFKAKDTMCLPPKIHFWNVVPGGTSSKWPGVTLELAPEKGDSWYKFTISNATSISLLFHDSCKYKSPDFHGISGGCFDAATNTWVDCTDTTSTSDSLAKSSMRVSGSKIITSSSNVIHSDVINIYPNPAQNYFVVDWANKGDKVVTITLTDILGNEILKEKSEEQGKFSKKINLEGIPSGIYFISIQSNNNAVIMKKLIKN